MAKTFNLTQILVQILVVLGVSCLGVWIIGQWLPLVWLMTGGGVGIGLWWADALYGLRYYQRDSHDQELITRSPLFVLIFAAVALFVVTSTDQHLGFGLVWGLSAALLVEGWWHVSAPTEFQQRFLTALLQKSDWLVTTTQALQIMVAATGFEVVLVALWLLRLA